MSRQKSFVGGFTRKWVSARTYNLVEALAELTLLGLCTGGGVATARDYFEISGPGDTSKTLSSTPIAGSERVYLNGQFLRPGSGNDYSITGANITLDVSVDDDDVLGVTYET